jgi:hypothetical protein
MILHLFAEYQTGGYIRKYEIARAQSVSAALYAKVWLYVPWVAPSVTEEGYTGFYVAPSPVTKTIWHLNVGTNDVFLSLLMNLAWWERFVLFYWTDREVLFRVGDLYHGYLYV